MKEFKTRPLGNGYLMAGKVKTTKEGLIIDFDTHHNIIDKEEKFCYATLVEKKLIEYEKRIEYLSEKLYNTDAHSIEYLCRMYGCETVKQFHQTINEALNKIPKWISVKNELPKPGTWCLVFHEGEIDSDHFADDYEHRFVYYGDKVTHWMPLPKKPEQK